MTMRGVPGRGPIEPVEWLTILLLLGMAAAYLYLKMG